MSRYRGTHGPAERHRRCFTGNRRRCCRCCCPSERRLGRHGCRTGLCWGAKKVRSSRALDGIGPGPGARSRARCAAFFFPSSGPARADHRSPFVPGPGRAPHRGPGRAARPGPDRAYGRVRQPLWPGPGPGGGDREMVAGRGPGGVLVAGGRRLRGAGPGGGRRKSVLRLARPLPDRRRGRAAIDLLRPGRPADLAHRGRPRS